MKAMRQRSNRKRRHFGEFFSCNGEVLIINANENQGVYVEILERMIHQLDAAISTHGRILVHRIDLHTTYFSSNNKIISKFMNRLKQWIKRNYGIEKIGYVWVREQERSKNQHYHLGLFLDGAKIRHPKKFNAQVKEMWTPNGYMPVVPSPFYFIDKSNRKEMRGSAIYRLSYLAKIRGKGYRDKQAKDFQTSRLKSISKS